MTEERLKEIKDSIYIAHRISCDPAISTDFRDKEELYNEVVRLREIIKKANKFVDEFIQEDYYEKLDEYITHFTWNTTRDDLLEILKLEQNNLTLKQINSINNE